MGGLFSALKGKDAHQVFLDFESKQRQQQHNVACSVQYNRSTAQQMKQSFRHCNMPFHRFAASQHSCRDRDTSTHAFHSICMFGLLYMLRVQMHALPKMRSHCTKPLLKCCHVNLPYSIG